MMAEETVRLVKELVDAVRMDGDPELVAKISDDIFEILASIMDDRRGGLAAELHVGQQRQTIEFLRENFPFNHAVWLFVQVVKVGKTGETVALTKEEVEEWFPSMEYQS